MEESKSLDQLEREIRSLKIEDVDFQMKNLQVAFLQLLGFCKKQQQVNSELAFQALSSAKHQMEAVITSGNNAMKDVMRNMTSFILETKMAEMLIKLARAVNYDLSYSYESKCILITVASVTVTEDEEKFTEDYYLTFAFKLTDSGKELFQLDLHKDIPKSVFVNYPFPLYFDTFDEVVAYLNRPGHMSDLSLEILNALEEQKEPGPNDLAASAVFSTE